MWVFLLSHFAMGMTADHTSSDVFPANVSSERDKAIGIPEPYEWLHGADAGALPARPASPDTLVQYTWNASVDSGVLQQAAFTGAVAVHAEPASSFENLASLTDPTSKINVLVKAPGWLRIDYGVELPGWLEGTSEDLQKTGQSHLLQASVSEFDEPFDVYMSVPVRMNFSEAPAAFRLEPPARTSPKQDLSGRLYEGVRFAWLCFAVECPWTGSTTKPSPPSPAPTNTTPWRLTDLRLIYKFQPLQYTGSFTSSDPSLEKIWYTGAYGVRANMQGADYGSVLMDRGDRVDFQGDQNPTMAVAAVAFGSPGLYELTRHALEKTDCYTRLETGKQFCRFPNSSFMFDLPRGAYPVYWTLSVCEYFWASGDVEEFSKLLPDVETILNDQINQFDRCLLKDIFTEPVGCNYEFMGWDDRVGYGLSEPMAAEGEPYRAFNSLIVQAVRTFADGLNAMGSTEKAANYSQTADRLAAKIRAAQPVSSFAVHSAARAANAGIFASDPQSVRQQLFARNLNDSTKICSVSPFNTYYTIQGLANLGYYEHAIATVKKCWEPMTRLSHGCFWEQFDPDWADLLHIGQKGPGRPSMCHPWSSGPTAFLSTFLLGVRAVTPGFEQITVTPFVSAAWPSVAGVVPVHSGKAGVKVNASFIADPHTTGSASVSITIDTPVPASVGFLPTPSAGCVLHSLQVNGEIVAGNTRGFGPNALSYLFSDVLPSGTHAVIGNYEQCQSISNTSGVYPFPAPTLPVATALDNTTHGTGWIGKYGADAYVLFGYDKHGRDRTSIPQDSFVKNISAVCCSRLRCSEATSQWIGLDAPGVPTSALLVNPNTSTSSLGYTSCGDGVILDVNTTTSERYQLAIYMVGTAGDLSIQTSRIMDLRTLNPIAKAVKVERFGAGTWLVFEYDQSARVRLARIDGSSSISAAMVSKV